MMFGIEGWGLGPLSGRGPGVSFVKTEENRSLSILALRGASLKVSPWLRRGETPVESLRRCLMYDQNLFCFVCRSLFVAAV